MERTYRTDTISDGESWVRIRAATLVAEIDGDPALHFQEQCVAEWGSGARRVLTECGACSLDLSDPDASFELRNTTTWAGTGVYMTNAELLQAIYSAWREAAAQRDGA